jgi:hypothetical protein
VWLSILGIPVVVLVGGLRQRRKLALLVAAVILLGLFNLTGCGGGSTTVIATPLVTPTGTSTVTATANSNGGSHQVTLTITVTQ